MLAEEGEKGSIPGLVIGYLIKKGETKKPGGKGKKKLRGRHRRGRR